MKMKFKRKSIFLFVNVNLLVGICPFLGRYSKNFSVIKSYDNCFGAGGGLSIRF
jgi:hypothetical protein